MTSFRLFNRFGCVVYLFFLKVFVAASFCRSIFFCYNYLDQFVSFIGAYNTWSFHSLIVGRLVIMGLKFKTLFLFSWFHFLRIHLLIYCSLKRNPCSLLHHTSVEIDWCWMWFNLGPFYFCKVIAYLNVVISLIGMLQVDWC